MTTRRETAPCTTHRAIFEELAEVGKALSSAPRLEVLELLAQAPRSVEVLARALNQSVANTSHHLQTLYRAGLVTRERDGLHIIYRVASDDVCGLLRQLQRVATAQRAALAELLRAEIGARDDLEALDLDALRERIRSGDIMLIDVRPAVEYEAAHVIGARSVPIDELERHAASLPRDRMIVAYCRGPLCVYAAEAAKQLRQLGFDVRRAECSIEQFSDTELERGAP